MRLYRQLGFSSANLRTNARRSGSRAGCGRGALAKGCPLAPDQVTMPAEQSLRTRHQGSPARLRQQPAEGSQENAITRLPGGLAHLALQDTELVAQCKHLGAELGVGTGADEHEIGDKADELVREAKKHGDRSWHRRSTVGHLRPSR